MKLLGTLQPPRLLQPHLKKPKNNHSIAWYIEEGFYNFKPQHCPHLVIFIIEYFDLIWKHKCNEWPLFYNIAILQLKKF